MIQPYKNNYDKKKRQKILKRLLFSTMRINSIANEIEIFIESLFHIRTEEDYQKIMTGLFFFLTSAFRKSLDSHFDFTN